MAGLTDQIDLATARLADVEAWIAPRVRAFVEVGKALLAIRERRLYLDAGYGDFRTYCRERWEMDDSRARQLCDAAQVAELTASFSTDGTTVPPVENEAQARALRDLVTQPEELNAVWREAAGRSQGKLTAALIREVRRERQRQRAPSPQPPPAPKPPQFPVAAHRIFAVITQAAEEVQALGGVSVLGEQMPLVSQEIRGMWMAAFRRVASLCADLASACGEPR